MELISWVWRCWQRQTYGINAGNTEGWFLHIFDNAKGCSQITDGRPDGIPRPLIFDEIGTGVFFFYICHQHSTVLFGTNIGLDECQHLCFSFLALLWLMDVDGC